MTFCYYANRSKPLSDTISEVSSWRKIELTQRPTSGQWTLSNRCWNTPWPKIFILCFFAYFVRLIPRYFSSNREWDDFPEIFLSIFLIEFMKAMYTYWFHIFMLYWVRLSILRDFWWRLCGLLYMKLYFLSIKMHWLLTFLFVLFFSSFISLL